MVVVLLCRRKGSSCCCRSDRGSNTRHSPSPSVRFAVQSPSLALSTGTIQSSCSCSDRHPILSYRDPIRSVPPFRLPRHSFIIDSSHPHPDSSRLSDSHPHTHTHTHTTSSLLFSCLSGTLPGYVLGLAGTGRDRARSFFFLLILILILISRISISNWQIV